MRRILTLVGFFTAVVVHAAVAPGDIAAELLAAPSIMDVDDQGADQLLHTFVKIAESDLDTIRAGLLIYDARVGEDEAQIVKRFFNNPVFLSVLFQAPRGPARQAPPSHVWYDRRDESHVAPDEVIEYSIPIEVAADGVVRLAYRVVGYEGGGARKISSVEVFDRCRANLERRKIDFTKQPNRVAGGN